MARGVGVDVGPVAINSAQGVEVLNFNNGERTSEPIDIYDTSVGPWSSGIFKTAKGEGNYFALGAKVVFLGVGVDWGEGPPVLPEPFVTPTLPLPALDQAELMRWIEGTLPPDFAADEAMRDQMRSVFESSPPLQLEMPNVGEGAGWHPQPWSKVSSGF